MLAYHRWENSLEAEDTTLILSISQFAHSLTQMEREDFSIPIPHKIETSIIYHRNPSVRLLEMAVEKRMPWFSILRRVRAEIQ